MPKDGQHHYSEMDRKSEGSVLGIRTKRNVKVYVLKSERVRVSVFVKMTHLRKRSYR